VLASRPIAWPFNLLDCCLVTDGGGALVVTSAERARDCEAEAGLRARHGRSVVPLDHLADAALPRLGRGADGGRARLAMCGSPRRSDVDLAMIYDAFTIVPILALEALGFCAAGEGGRFVAPGARRPAATCR
jgi:acetyl-CoA acetyltransferase